VLVVLGAALLMQLSGLSMAMGAFLAGVLLSESTFRHQIEADIEPFRGILLGLFFLSVGMTLDLPVVAANWPLIVGMVAALMAAKATCIYAVARLMGSAHAEALDRGVVMAQGGEFAFVLFSAAAAAGVIDQPVNANLTAVVVLSMALTPLVVLLHRRLVAAPGVNLDGVEKADGLDGTVLLIGFGRFGQVASQSLLARDVDVTIIDSDVEMIHSAARFGFRIYYGDGTRLDVLRASGAGSARAIAVCVDDRDASNRIVELVRTQFPQAAVLVRSYDREHALELIHAGVDYQVRETFESALAFGQAALMELGVQQDEARDIAEQIRRRDAERFELEMAEGMMAGARMVFGNDGKGVPTPTPFTPPRRPARTLNPQDVPAAGNASDRGAGGGGS
jgi:Kef-type K+ transport systems, membrane components